MADNFRTNRNRDPVAGDDYESAGQETASDPLAELARLIGQGDPYGERGHRQGQPQSADDAPTSGVEWAADQSYADDDGYADDRYVQAPPAPSYAPMPPPVAPFAPLAPQGPSYAPAPQDHDQEDEPPAGPRFFSGPAQTFNGFRDDNGAEPTADRAPYADEPPPVSSAFRLPGFGSAPRDQRDQAQHRDDDPGQNGGQRYADEDYDDEPEAPRRRSGLVVVMAVLALLVIGTAGAFGYRAMFGGSVLPTLPPIIKANVGPNKIVPANGDAPATTPSQAAASGTGPGPERLAPPPEQPVDIQQPAKMAPRVVSTIPIAPGQSSAGPDAMSPNVSGPVATAPIPAAPAVAAPPPPAALAPPAAPASASEPKKVHTVTIRADQPGAHAAAAPPPLARRPNMAAAAPPRGNEPLSIVPGAGGDAPAPARMHAAAPPMVVASAAPANAPAAMPSSSGGGGYAVQVTSQRSEAEAKTAFRALRTKFPKELGGRDPIVRRADLGDKGTYYRALVGPFASMEEAAGVCSSLKAAGGSCLVQRN